MNLLQPQDPNQDKKNLKILSILFLVLAALNVVSVIASYALGELSPAYLMEKTQVSESLARTSVTVVIVIAALSVLVLAYLGLMGLRQCKGKPTGKSHITLAKICMAFLFINVLSCLLSTINAPGDNWVDLCSSVASVIIGFAYIRLARSIK